jgi:hypothetical protein
MIDTIRRDISTPSSECGVSLHENRWLFDVIGGAGDDDAGSIYLAQLVTRQNDKDDAR